jgi:molybdenum cofactor cytidylyltransferase
VITAIILAAGESKRMGRPKMLLPWKDSTVLGSVLATYRAAGLKEILVVTGGARRQVEALLGTRARAVYNPDFDRGEMLSSLQAGLRALGSETEAALIGIGDQPQLEGSAVRAILDAFRATGAVLIVPSYRMKRGHPWLAARSLWGEILAMQAPDSPREFINSHAAEIHYVNVDTPGVVQDLDTPDEYERIRKQI